ncbi:hypothetical protein Pmani_015853 [Petrolisthes manimaculis]|uniref:RRM domain-containing protein n=1 Tax=Petrolisthes manimaculis TaxID=1843537 RepID=A0AAE1PQS9_9EUCA|nr:hypothetical protein Pmani_015853 [Petrolisthes manimaculis]
MSFESTTSSALPEGETRTNLIINYLPQTLTDQEFYKIFVVVGPIKNCRIMKDLKQTGYSFGFGFVEYQKPEDAAKAILQLNNLPVQHKRIKVSYARPPGEDIKETNLYIQNIPRSYTLDQLEELFAVFGQIVQKNLLKDKVTGLPRGVGFVRFDKKCQAEAAITGMNGVVPEGGTEPLVVKVAEEHGKMKAAYYAGYHAGRGRGNYNNRGGSGGGGSYQGRGNYNNMRTIWIESRTQNIVQKFVAQMFSYAFTDIKVYQFWMWAAVATIFDPSAPLKMAEKDVPLMELGIIFIPD